MYPKNSLEERRLDERREGPDRFDISFRDGPYATFTRRAMAFLIDCMLMAGCVAFVESLLRLAWAQAVANRALVGIYLCSSALQMRVSIWLPALYFPVMECAWQATLGKIAMGIKVTDMQGRRLSVFRAFARNVLKVVCLGVLGPFILIPLFWQRKQAFHDQLSGCLVLYRENNKATPPISLPALEGREPSAPPAQQEGITARGAVQEPKRP
jgi:uncharacterized RDD family membrane protein YckC